MSHSVKVVSSNAEYPEVYTQGKSIRVRDTYKNLKWLLDKFKAVIRYNLMTRRREIDIPNHFIFSGDRENSALSLIDYIATMNEMPLMKLDSHLDRIAFESTYHPIIECIKSKAWDGMDRLDKFIATIKSNNMELSKKIIKTWMMAAIGALHAKDGFINQGVLVLQGAQSVGKTNWVKSLDPANCGAVKEGAILDPTNKDNVIMLSRHWIVELGELDATFKKADIARLKSFVTMQADDVRFPYSRKETRLERRTVYAATVNEENFLSDETGNRRWWTVHVESIDRNHGIDMQQVWAEAMVRWALGDLPYLEDDIQAEVNSSNKDHEKLDPMYEKVLTFYDWNSQARKNMTATAVLEEIGWRNIGKSEATRMGNTLREINKKDSRKINGLRFHEVPISRN